jgi:hypothetical protein
MRFANLLTAVAATSLVAAPAIANPASSLSVVKASTATKKSSNLAGTVGGVPIIAGLIGVGILAGVVILVADHEDDDQPDSN